MIENTPRELVNKENRDYTGFNGNYSLNIQHAFDALELLMEEPDLSVADIKERLGGEEIARSDGEG